MKLKPLITVFIAVPLLGACTLTRGTSSPSSTSQEQSSSITTSETNNTSSSSESSSSSSDPSSSESSSIPSVTFDYSLYPETAKFTINAVEMYYQYGDATLFTLDYGEDENFDILVDGGNRGYDGYSGTRDALLELLSRKLTDGVLDMVVLSHEHADHYGGFDNRALFMSDTLSGVRYVVDNGISGYNSTYTAIWETNVRDYWVRRGATYLAIQDIMETDSRAIEMGPGAYCHFLDTGYYPEKGDNGQGASNTNDHSIAMCIRAGETAVVLAGDLSGENQEQSLMRLNSDEDGDPWFLEGAETVIYKAAHHGASSYGCNSLEYVRWLRPDWAWVSSAIEPANQTEGEFTRQHPYKAAVDRIVSALYTGGPYATRDEANDHFFYVGTTGNLAISFEGNSFVSIHGEGRKACSYYDVNGDIVNPDDEKDLPFYKTAFYTKWISTFSY